MNRFAALVLAIGSLWAWSGGARIVLLDGSAIVARGEIGHEKNMLSFVDQFGQPTYLSKGLVDWEATWRNAPELVARFRPDDADLFQAKAVIAEAEADASRAQSRPGREIVITNETLSQLKPGQGLASAQQGAALQARSDALAAAAANAPVKRASAAKGAAVIETISKGERVDLKSHLDPDRYVIFDFYADWCGPCRVMDPKLKALVKKYPGHVALKKIDIVNWSSAVSRQHNVRAIPRVVVYDPDGNEKLDGHGAKAIAYIERVASKNNW